MRAKRITAALCVLMGMACGGGDDGGTSLPPAPKVTAITPLTVVPGDTLTISGSNFSSVASENTVTFNNPISGRNPVSATKSQLRVLVDRDAVSGPVTVTTAGGSAASADAISVTRGVGDVFVFGGTSLTLPNPSPSARYLVIPHAVNSQADYRTNFGYKIASSTAVPLEESVSQASGRSAQIGARELFEARRWQRAEETVKQYGAPARTKQTPATSAAAPAVTKQFYVLKTVNIDEDDPAAYKQVTAELRYTGTKCLVYSDIDTLPTGNFTQADYNEFGQTYDNSIEPTNVSFFGPYSDVDGNGKLIMLITPVVNRLEENCDKGKCQCGFIAGFFNPRDLYTSPPVPAKTTNHAEIIYLLASDPTGFWDCAFSHDFAKSENLSTIPHEHQHLTSFSWRIFHENSTIQVTWLEEGMAHMAEDLNGDNSSNMRRGQDYRENPDGISLEDNKAPLAQRGGIYLMLRLAADRYGTAILKDILQSKCTGRACIQNVTGMNYNDFLAEFLAAQYLSGKGITDDTRFNYQTIDINDFGPLEVSGDHIPGGTVNGTVRKSSGAYHTYSGVGASTHLQFTDVSKNALLRNVIVRIE